MPGLSRLAERYPGNNAVNRSAKTAILVAATTLGISLIIAPTAHAGGGSSWGWKKPMNKRMGGFYTSNRNANFSRSNQRKVSSRYVNYPSQYSATPIPTPQSHVPSSYVPHQRITVQTPNQRVVNPVVIRNQPVAAPRTEISKPQTQADVRQNVSPLPNSWTETDKPSPAATTPGAALLQHRGILPHKSTTNTFWQ